MSDIHAFYRDGVGGIEVRDDDVADFVADDGLETSILISLLTDRRAREDDELPQAEGGRRGWWAGNEWGSRLWLLERSPVIPETLAKAEMYAEEALQWMLEDGVAQAVTASASGSTLGGFDIAVEVTKPNGEARTFTYYFNWEAERVRSR